MTQSSQDTTTTPTDTKSTNTPASNEVRKSVVGKNFSIHGDLTCQDILHIDGSVEGNISCQQLTVGEGGKITGDIRADTVDMSGTLTGAIEARVLTLYKTSNVVGDIVVHESLGIEPGAHFDGSCKKFGVVDDQADDNAAGDGAAEATQMQAAEPEAPVPDAPAPEAPTPDAPAPQAEASDSATADAPDERQMTSTAKVDDGAARPDNMSRALDKVAAELKASIDLAGSDKPAAEAQAKPAPVAHKPADDAPDAGPAPDLTDPSDPVEKLAAALTKPATNGLAAPATMPAAAPGPAKPATACSADATNG